MEFSPIQLTSGQSISSRALEWTASDSLIKNSAQALINAFDQFLTNYSPWAPHDQEYHQAMSAFTYLAHLNKDIESRALNDDDHKKVIDSVCTLAELGVFKGSHHVFNSNAAMSLSLSTTSDGDLTFQLHDADEHYVMDNSPLLNISVRSDRGLVADNADQEQGSNLTKLQDLIRQDRIMFSPNNPKLDDLPKFKPPVIEIDANGQEVEIISTETAYKPSPMTQFV
ncbi:hypothetical protein [uncultured Shewanella sp.]|uniref:hypothetical protein n=1 Tax=uncultured Shewanella sp. TaxID=173975 RepID=UPI002607760A|nr:hypothetical protein [uncultured Shewanella sp.]